jgi:hypothetical protein
MAETLEVFDEVLVAAPPAVLRRSVLVIGVTSMAFWPEAFPFSSVMEPRSAWWSPPRPRTLVTHAAARSPALLDARHPVRRMLPRSIVIAAKQRFRCWRRLIEVLPAHPGEWLASRGTWRFQTASMQRRQRSQAVALPDKQTLPPIKDQMAWHLAQAKRFGSPCDARQFDAFSALVRRATDCGMRVVVIDMPLHSEHLAHPSHFAAFKDRLADAVSALNAEAHGDGHSVELLDLTAALGDVHFADLAHANKESRQAWVDLLVDRLRPLLADPPSSSHQGSGRRGLNE